MEEQTWPAIVMEKRPYAPPNATFIPLKLEERLLACAKVPTGLQVNLCLSTPESS